jgi:hypothetical protein
MKRLLYILVLLPIGINAQNMYNVSSLFGNDLTGTARYVGMGGSMSALGADMSTMGTNPAGMAMYRSNDVSITAAVDVKTNRADYEGSLVESGNTNAFIGNAAMVCAIEVDDEYLKYFNFGLGYRQKNNLAGAFEMYGASNGFSQQYVMEYMYRNNMFQYDNLKDWMYKDFAYSWLQLLAADAGLYDDKGNFITYPDFALLWAPDELAYYEETRGGVYTVDFNLAADICDRVYLGATLAVSTVDYTRYTEYIEAAVVDNPLYQPRNIYILENNSYVKGSGCDLKLGVILRPFKYSPFKVGFAFHTPTWYSLREYSSADIIDSYGVRISTTDKVLYGDMLSIKSKLKTPWRLNASMAYTFGTYVALNAEYEYADYTKGAFTSRGSVYSAQNDEIKYNMKAQHTVRVGAELNVDGFAARLGYNYMTAPFVNGAYKELYNASVTETSTEYMNRFDKSVITSGIGFHGKMLYFDLAYALEMQKAEFYPFYDFEAANPGAAVTMANHSVVATLGMRF